MFEAYTAAGLLPQGPSPVTYDERPLTVALPEILVGVTGAIGGMGDIRSIVKVPAIVACHACAHLSVQIAEMAAEVASIVVDYELWVMV